MKIKKRVQIKQNTLFHLTILTCIAALALYRCGGEWRGLENFTDSVLPLTYSPSSIDFGYITVGNYSTSIISISNNGDEDLRISDITISDTSNYSLDLFGGENPCGSTNPTIPAGETRTVSVTFSPASSETCSAILTIVSDSPNLSQASVTLTGTAEQSPASVIGIFPTFHNFGNTETGSFSEPMVITVTNSGTADLTISEISISGSETFSLDLHGGSQPFGSSDPTIPPDESRTVSVTFGPDAEGVFEGELKIVSNNPENSTMIALLSGTGQYDAPPTREVSLAWQAPSTNVDGTPVTDLAGFKIYFGPSSGYYTDSIDVGKVYTYTLENLPAATLYFCVTAYDTMGNESEFSNEGSKTFN
ncbi:MAG: choice-of-anchor D domain-containing protein [Planctomycetota bacterium]|jgi:hypothetical protein